MINKICESRTRIVEVDGDKIIFTLKLDGVKDYLSYDERLLEVLALDKLKPFRDKGRLRIKVRHNNADVNMYLYDLAIACYNGLVNTKTFIEDMQKYFDYKSLNDLSVDHADSNIHNNTVFNLSLMDRTTNMRKNACVARVKEPVYLNSAYVDGKYRIQMLFVCALDKLNKIFDRVVPNFITQGGIAAIHYICVSPKKYSECLNMLINNHYEWSEPLKDDRGNWVKSENGCWCANIFNSMHAQSVLSRMDENLFMIYK